MLEVLLLGLDSDSVSVSDSVLAYSLVNISLAAREKTSSTLLPVLADVSMNLSILFSRQ